MSDVMQGRDYRRQSGLKDAAQQFFARYIDFSGRSNRGEFWFWVIDAILISIAIGLLDAIFFGGETDPLSALWGLVTFIPSIALSVRRLHDIGRTGWWVLIALVPLIGWLVLIWFHAQPPEDGPNKWG